MSLVSGGDQETNDASSGDELGSDIPVDDPLRTPTPARSSPDQPTVGQELTEHAKDMSRVTGSLAIDGVFVVLVGLMNWGADQAIEGLDLAGVSATVFLWVQLLLAASTIGAVAIRVVADLLVMIVRAWKQVRRG